MSETSQKSSRKSKLVPRSQKDGDDSDILQDEPRNKIAKVHTNIDSKQNEPTTSTYQPLQFDIKIEVEECDEAFNDTTTDFIQDLEIKTEIINENDLFEVEERDINFFLAQAISKKKVRQHNTVALEKDHDYSLKAQGSSKLINKKSNSKKLPNSQKKLSELQIKEDDILNALDELTTGDESLADKILGIEMRNMWGRYILGKHEPSMPDRRIQIALIEKYWRVSLKYGEFPLMYKCYICEKAWWHLGPFQDHMAIHKEILSVESELQVGSKQYNIIAYSVKSEHIFKNFKIDSNCWRCGFDFEHHIKTEKPYVCKYCSVTFHMCKKLLAHEAECVKQLRMLVKSGPIVVFTCHICQLKLLYKEKLEQHYLDYHSVRSDLPTFVPEVRNCMSCSRNYFSHPFHYCNNKNFSTMCNYCEKKFPSKIALDIHLEKESNYPCVVCGEKVKKKCMLAEHMLKHTDKFVMLQKCLSCKDNIVLLFDDESLRRHTISWHKKKFDKRRNYFQKVIVPRKSIEAQIQQLEGSWPEPGQVLDNVKTENDDTASSAQVNIEIFSKSELDKAIESITLKDSEPSTSVQIKQEEEDFEEFHDSMVKEKMIQEMQKNNNFTEDDEGYEYILSSVFNASNGSMLETEIAEEVDDFEELLKKELEKSKKKKPKKVKKTSPSAKPTTSKPTTSKPTQSKPTTSKPTTSKPTTSKPTTSKQVELTMDSRKELADPETIRNVTPKFKCDYLDCDFIGEREALKAHRDVHKIILVTCSKCNKPFSSYRSYLGHLTKHGFLKWSCPECMKSYSSYASCTAHVKTKAFKSFSESQLVGETRDKFVVRQCKKCKETVPLEFLFDHWEKHLGVSEPNIVKVEIREEDREIVFGDVMEHEEPDNRIPENVDAEVMERVIAALVVHNKHRSDNKSCMACGRTFERRNDCKRHHIEHLLANAYSTKRKYKGLRCQICFKTYDRPDGYKQHMRDHGHLPVYKCQLCFKTFSDSSNYVKHKKTHSSMFICDICKKRFQAKSSLIKHMQCHITVEPIGCILCPKLFFTESDFSRHIRSAHNQSLFKYSCIVCKKKFKSTKDKWDHMWIEHKERQVKADCPVCSAEFRKVTDVKQHLRSEHEMEISVMNMKVFRELLKKVDKKKILNDKSKPVTIKTEEEDEKTPYVVVRSEENKKQFQIYHKNDMLAMMNRELLENSPGT